jgi:methionine aminopeptidase
MIEPKNVCKFNNNNIQLIYDVRKTLAFCPRWFDFEIPENKSISKYPVLKTIDGGLVAQYEKTIYIKDNGIDIIN